MERPFEHCKSHHLAVAKDGLEMICADKILLTSEEELDLVREDVELIDKVQAALRELQREVIHRALDRVEELREGRQMITDPVPKFR